MNTQAFSFRRSYFLRPTCFALLFCLLFSACRKQDHSKPPPQHNADVVDKWMTMQLRLMRNATGIPNQAFSRHFAYSGVTALGAMLPVLENRSWIDRLNGLTGMPIEKHWKNYFMPANVNAALAAINRSFFPNASAIDKSAIDSLEAALKNEFLSTQPASVIATSEKFGQDVATAVFNWAETDGYKNAGAPYTPPIGPGLWKPTPPAFAPASTPYWGANRTIIDGSLHGLRLPAPPAYSIEPASDFFKMVKVVYDASQSLTDDQKAMAIFWRDVPGPTTPGHWLSIVQQVVKQKKTTLENAALGYALTGAAVNDVLIACFKAKYEHNLLRPVTYIREVMGQTGWNSFIATPAHPEYPSNHAALSIAAAEVMEYVFGKLGSLTDHTNDYLGQAPRNYSSFKAIGEEAGQSRVYGGIHYQFSVDRSFELGRQVVKNILPPKFSHREDDDRGPNKD